MLSISNNSFKSWTWIEPTSRLRECFSPSKTNKQTKSARHFFSLLSFRQCRPMPVTTLGKNVQVCLFILKSPSLWISFWISMYTVIRTVSIRKPGVWLFIFRLPPRNVHQSTHSKFIHLPIAWHSATGLVARLTWWVALEFDLQLQL